MENANKTVRFGVIGVGNIGFVHATCLFRGNVPGARLAALCDCKSEMREELESLFPGVPFYTDFRELLKNREIDAVIVSVPHPMHSKIAIAAFEMGKHVLVEKPMDIRLSSGKKLCDAAKASGKQFGIMFNQRTGNLFATAREIVRSGELGQLKRSVWIITNWYRTQYYYNSGTWRATWSGEGGGVLVNQAPHQLDLWQWICGMPDRVTAFCEEAKYHDIQVEDEATLLVRFPGGAEGVFITSTGEYPGTNRLEITGSKGKLVLENGVLKWWKLEVDEREFCFSSDKSFAHVPMTFQEIAEDIQQSGHQKILGNFTNSILYGEPLMAPGYDGINELTLQNAAYLSSWKGNIPVDLPFDEEEYDSLLRDKQMSDTVKQSGQSAEKETQYKARWQIQW